MKRGEATKTATKEYVTHQSLGCLPLAVFAPIHDPLCSPFTYPSLSLHFPATFPSLTRVFQVRQAQGRARQGGEGAAPREVVPPCIFDRQEPLNCRVVVVVIERIVTLFWANKCATKDERRGAGARAGFGAIFVGVHCGAAVADNGNLHGIHNGCAAPCDDVAPVEDNNKVQGRRCNFQVQIRGFET